MTTISAMGAGGPVLDLRGRKLDEAPVPLVVMAVEEAAANEGVEPKVAWRGVASLAKTLAVHRQALWM